MNRAILWCAVLVCLGVASAWPEPSFTFRVTGCARTETGRDAPKRGTQESVGARIEVIGGGIRYARAGAHQCCRGVEVRQQVQEKQILLTEYWTGAGCRCMCFSQIEATLTNLVAGEYAVTVRSGGVQAGTQQAVEPQEILSQKVKIP